VFGVDFKGFEQALPVQIRLLVGLMGIFYWGMAKAPREGVLLGLDFYWGGFVWL
jgi:hypothetical protein